MIGSGRIRATPLAKIGTDLGDHNSRNLNRSPNFKEFVPFYELTIGIKMLPAVLSVGAISEDYLFPRLHNPQRLVGCITISCPDAGNPSLDGIASLDVFGFDQPFKAGISVHCGRCAPYGVGRDT
jgi:hypothetical protein